MSEEKEGPAKARTQGRGRKDSRVRALLVLLLLPGVSGRVAAQQAGGRPAACVECHAKLSPSLDRALGHGNGQSMTCLTCHHVGFSSEAATEISRRERACVGCHKDLAPTHAGIVKGTPGCTTCHSIHGDTSAATAAAAISRRCEACHERPHALHAGVKEGPICTDCHAGHGERLVGAAVAVQSAKCGACHRSAHPTHAGQPRFATACTRCHSVNARGAIAGTALNRVCTSCHTGVAPAHAGVASGAPQCVDCHAVGTDGPLPAATASISQRCGACHAGAMRSYLEGGHARGLATTGRNQDLPTCVSCHRAHGGEGARAEVRHAATARCIACHSNAKLARKYGLKSTVGASYVEDFHGATLEFMSQHPAGARQPSVLTCSDCHGAHAVSKDPRQALSAVCLRCHEGGDRKLAGAWLGHAPPGPRNRPLIWMARLFYYVLIPFMLIGLALNILFSLIDQKRKGARALETEGMRRLRARLTGRKLAPEPSVVRFNRRERLEHLGSMVTFIVLTITGLPQTRPDLSFAAGMIEAFGGIQTTRLIHRVVGCIFVLLMVSHVGRAIVQALRQRRLPVMVPRKTDFLDMLQTLKHFVWRAPRPKTGKFDFAEKFEYWGLFLGGTLMSVTGLSLIFTAELSHVLPGVVLATFRVLHGLEATFAVLVVVLWHSYGVVLRPEVFPLDTSIFTGKMSVRRLEEEHELEYERLCPDGRPESDEAVTEIPVLAGAAD